MAALESLTPVSIDLIALDGKSRPVLARHPRLRVSMVVNALRSPDRPSIEDLFDYWSHVSRAEVLAALCYYESHRADLDAEIDREDAEADALLSRMSVAEKQAGLREKLLARMAANGRTPGAGE